MLHSAVEKWDDLVIQFHLTALQKDLCQSPSAHTPFTTPPIRMGDSVSLQGQRSSPVGKQCSVFSSCLCVVWETLLFFSLNTLSHYSCFLVSMYLKYCWVHMHIGNFCFCECVLLCGCVWALAKKWGVREAEGLTKRAKGDREKNDGGGMG